jgi:hypothetical protein
MVRSRYKRAENPPFQGRTLTLLNSSDNFFSGTSNTVYILILYSLFSKPFSTSTSAKRKNANMQTFIILPFLSMIAAAVAAPQVQPRNGGAGDCTAYTDKQLCCNSVLNLLSVNCLVQVLGAPCSTNTYCCQNDNYNVSI